MSQPKTYKYINGLWVNKVKGTEMIGLDITEEAMQAIQALPKNDKGFRRLTMAPQKKDPRKYSVWENDFVPTKKNDSDPSSGKTPAQNIEPTDGDDLPF